MAEKNKTPFAAASRQQWLAAALKEWQGATFAEKSFKIEGGIEIKPYYDLADYPLRNTFALPVSQNEVLGSRAWFNMPLIGNANDNRANSEALQALQHGADGLVFEPSPSDNSVALLSGIEFNYCALSFKIKKDHRNFSEGLNKEIMSRGYPPESIVGGVFQPLLQDSENDIDLSEFEIARLPQFRTNGIALGELSTDTLAMALAKASKKIEDADRFGSSIDEALRSIAFMVPIGNDFFSDLSRLRALRMLWSQIASAWLPEHNGHTFLHAVSKALIAESWQPHGNMIKETTAAMSAILGGCDALTILPEDLGSDTMKRISLNVSSILREESRFAKVADPVAGSYFIESHTDEIARVVWKKFQELS